MQRWPFDWIIPFGYFVAWIGHFTGGAAVLLIAIQCFGIVFGSCWIFIVIANDITNDMATVNKIVKIHEDIDSADLMKRFCNLIQEYSGAKQ